MARQPSDALNAPVIKQYGRESLSDDIAVPQAPTISDASDLADEVIVTNAERANKEYLDELRFMEEKVEIIMNPGREKHSPLFEMFGVNGVMKAVMVNQPTAIERKYVEVMARSMPMDIATRSGEDPGDSITYNKIDRSMSAGFSFAVIKDNNPRGHVWLQQLRSDNMTRRA